MNTQRGSAIILIIVILVILGGIFLFIMNQEEIPEATEPVSTEQNDEATPTEETGVMEDGTMETDNIDEVMDQKSDAGTYEEYSPEKVSEALGKKIVLFFHAKWCPTCRGLESAILDEVDQIPSDVVILKTDYDTYTELKKKYGVTVQHTLVQVDTEGNLITKWMGGASLDDVLSNLKLQ